MEMAELLDFGGVIAVRKPRTFSSRKPKSGGSHTWFFNEQHCSSPSSSPPSDPRNVVNTDKGLNDAAGKSLNSHSHGDDRKRKLRNSNSMVRFEMGKDDLGRSLKSGDRIASGDDDLVPERVEIKRVRMEFADLNGKQLGSSPNCDRNYDSRGSKSQDYEHRRSSEKSSREKSLRDSKESKEYSMGEKVERERGRFSKTFKRKCNGDDLDRSKSFHEGRMERKDSYERHASHERLEHDRDRDQDQDQDRDRSLDVQGRMKSNKGGQGLGHSHKPVVVVGLGAGEDWCNSDGYNVLEKRSLDSHANSTCNAGGIKKRGAEGSSVPAKLPHATEGRRQHQRLILQEDSDDEEDCPVRVEIQDSPKKKPQVNTWAAIAKLFIQPAKKDQKGQLVDEGTSGKQVKLTNNVVANQPVRKSSRIPKKRILDGEHCVDDDAEKALQPRSSRTMKHVQNGEYDKDEECETLQHQSSKIPKKRMLDGAYEEDNEVQQHKRRWKRSQYRTDSEHLCHEDAEEHAALGDEDVEKTDIDLEGLKKRSNKKQGFGNSILDDNKEVPLTARQRTMQCKDAVSEIGANLIEFPEGLTQTRQRKQEQKLSEVEQQLKKTEAAQRRKMQLEKAANASQAEAIKKILGKDSSSKKREDKLQKQRDAMAQKKAASAKLLASNGVRWVMGPSGTVVSFSENIGLPNIFNNQCRYPPPREKCAGPLCNNTYKYRHSRTNLPLCSLQCYRAVHDVEHPVSTH